ncbi:PAS domain-containing sensor histidine kinase [Pontibacter beigongshangensis]|uniref:PAS domain-containing sensor histidine kinase n=1 Tax=Pontibacter beigongshangensis TaxID=2574733 RepID=UPI00164F8042|nr:PAS domain-containing sensor histidine kinase [Pontibacter beigongshangensis]
MDTRLLEKIGESSPKVFFLYNLTQAHFEYLNKAIEKIWNGTLDGFLHKPDLLLELVHPDDFPLLSTNFDLLLQGQTCSLDFRLHFPGSFDKIIHIEAYPITDEQDKVVSVAGIVEDITPREQYLAYLVEFTRKKNTALEIVAHDLRGPLAIVQSIADSLEKDHQQHVYDEISNYTRFIKQACEACVNLISDILSEEHLKSNTVNVNLERLDMVEKVRNVVETYASSNSISQAFEIRGPSKAFAMADIVKMDQIMNNLIANSIKFTRPDGKITITIQDEPTQLLIVHADNGIGIPPEDQPYLFERFTKAARAGLSGEKSVGIGLSIVKDLVEIQGGRIWFESKENEGTTFYISLSK